MGNLGSKGHAQVHGQQRYITTHDPETGKGVFESSIPSTPPEIEFPGGLAVLQNLYVSEGFPHQLADDADVKTYQRYLSEPPGIMIANGTIVRTVNFKPGASSHMHRTPSIDCGVIVDGEVVLELDSGEKRLLRRGDVFVQRATMHAWHNPSKTQTASMVVFIQPVAPLEIAGKPLAEEHLA
ncbi:hypothetical protein VTO42DRAFT_6119 [Malbranchea cinnamomea]